ncbi:MAG: hypothetical protein SWH68_02435, partial [Thermodesulfobacteriota bacterium]|nr:hypothetical protein [Thermodesulfobacteriota bacterium]
SSFINKLIGLGPGNFNNLMKKYMNTEAYAHNEFISSIVETGVLGFFSFIVWIGAFFYQIKLRSRPSDYFYHIAIAFFIAFFVNALGTMPFRSIRHLMTFGVYVGVILSFPVLSNNNQKISSIKERK